MAMFTLTAMPQVDAELPTLSRRWSLADFRERLDAVYGAGRLVEHAWPDQNLHSDPEAAAKEGLSGPVAAAPQLIAMIHHQMSICFGTGWFAGGQIDVKMIKPVFVDELTSAKGRVVEVQEHAGQSPRVQCEVWVERLDGVKVLVGTASGLVHE